MTTATKYGMKSGVATKPLPSLLKGRNNFTKLEHIFIRLGLDSLTDEEVIGLLLNLASPSGKCEKLTKECIKQFGSLRRLIEASPEELQQYGLTYRTMLCIRLLSEIPSRILKQKISDNPVYCSSQEIFDYLYYSMRGLRSEVFKVIHLNGRNQIIETLELFRGSVNNIPVCPREIVESAIKYGAVSMIFAHNHPSGDPAPSKSDRKLTRDLVFIGSVIQIRVLDHIIIGDNSHFSFAAEGLIEKYEDSFLMLRMKAGA
jgi:DNA repair protein RadC